MVNSLANGYRTASPLALWTALLLVALTITEVLAILSMASQIQLLEAAQFGAIIPPAQAESQDGRQRLLGTIELTLWFAAELSFLVWVYWASRNAHALGAEGMRFSPGWSVGWFFVPLAGLYMPCLVFRELWKASTPSAGAHWQKIPVSPVVGLWWVMCLAAAVTHYSPWGIVAGKWRLTDSDRFEGFWLPALMEFSRGFLIAEIIGIVVNVLTVVVIFSITHLQENRRFLLADLEMPEFATRSHQTLLPDDVTNITAILDKSKWAK